MIYLPAAPLFDAAAYTANKPLHRHGCPYCFDSATLTAGCLKTEELAQRLGVTRRTVNRWTTRGIPVNNADKAATYLGFHPVTIWGFNWDDTEYAALVYN